MSVAEHETTNQATAAAASAEEPRSQRFNLRATPSQDAIIRQAAAARRMSVTDFMLEASLAEAQRALHEDRRLVLMNEVFDRLAEELDESDEPVQALVELIKRPRTLRMPE